MFTIRTLVALEFSLNIFIVIKVDTMSCRFITTGQVSLHKDDLFVLKGITSALSRSFIALTYIFSHL